MSAAPLPWIPTCCRTRRRMVRPGPRLGTPRTASRKQRFTGSSPSARPISSRVPTGAGRLRVRTLRRLKSLGRRDATSRGRRASTWATPAATLRPCVRPWFGWWSTSCATRSASQYTPPRTGVAPWTGTGTYPSSKRLNWVSSESTSWTSPRAVATFRTSGSQCSPPHRACGSAGLRSRCTPSVPCAPCSSPRAEPTSTPSRSWCSEGAPPASPPSRTPERTCAGCPPWRT
mmetsp:Transcript_38018/g.94503  ORF Transcript_38018/g.94503 Transcript_38018/m.94503 type:complete len:231 (+) Transcript_38018:1827-2519(+)